METTIIEDIELYLNQEIDKSTLEQRAQAQNVENLEKEIQWVEETQLAIEAVGLKQQIKNVLPKNAKREGKVVKGNFGKMAALSIAATIVLLFGIFFFLQPNNNEKLYSKYEFNDPGIPVLMSETDRFELYEALTYYSEQNYEETIERLAAIKSKSIIQNDTVDFYLGVSQLYSNDIESSLPLLDELRKSENSVFKERAEYLYALAYLKANNIEKTKALLQPIANNEAHTFYQSAKDLLVELK